MPPCVFRFEHIEQGYTMLHLIKSHAGIDDVIRFLIAFQEASMIRFLINVWSNRNRRKLFFFARVFRPRPVRVEIQTTRIFRTTASANEFLSGGSAGSAVSTRVTTPFRQRRLSK